MFPEGGVTKSLSVAAIALSFLLCSPASPGANRAMSDHQVDIPQGSTISLPDPVGWPLVACTPVELARLRSALGAGEGAAYNAVIARVRAAEQTLGQAIDFPPEGGQHNQWHQCDVCQIALERVNDTHHRCPKCDTVYSGYPFDQVIYQRRHSALTRDMEQNAWAFAITDETRFAQRARDILVGYGERYLGYPLHSANQGTRDETLRVSGGHVFEQTLNEAAWTREVASTYDLIRQSNVVSPQDHAIIRDGLLRPLFETIDRHHGGKSNWQTYHNSAFLYLGALLGDVDIIRQALLDPENGFYYQMNVSVLPGGMWYENSWSYHFYTLSAIERTVETARRLGIDLYGLAQVRDMFTVALDYQMVDGTLPRFGDATTTRIPAANYEVAWHQWRDPAFHALLTEDLTFIAVLYGRQQQVADIEPPVTGSVLKEGPGHAILRIDGAEGPTSAVLAFGPFGGSHGHFDKLSFVSFAMGQELAHDPGRALSQAYRLPVHQDWYRPTISHNTVLVDRTSQEGASGVAEVFLSRENLAAVAARTQQAYPGILHRRLLVQRPSYLLVADELHAADGTTHTFDWLYHQRGDGVTSPQATRAADVTDFGTGFEYIQDARVGPADGVVQATLLVGSDRTEVIIDGGDPTEVLVGTGVGESVEDRVPLMHVTRSGASVGFAAAVEPLRDGAAADVVAVSMEHPGPGDWTVRVRLAHGVEEVFDYDTSGATRSIDGVASSAQLLCLRRETTGAVIVLGDAGPLAGRP